MTIEKQGQEHEGCTKKAFASLTNQQREPELTRLGQIAHTTLLSALQSELANVEERRAELLAAIAAVQSLLATRP